MPGLPDTVKHAIAKFRETSKLMYDMAGTYPGDTTGEISKEGFIMEVMAELLEDASWNEIMTQYESDNPILEITVE